MAPDVSVAASAALHEEHALALRAILAAPGLPPAGRLAAQGALDALGTTPHG